MTTPTTDTHPLNNKWTLWLHNKNERSWKPESFIKIYDIYTVEDFWNVYNNIRTFCTEIFFLMRDDIFPLWETPENVNGGTWNIIVPRKTANKIWIELSCLTIGMTLLNKHFNSINGISIRPKFSNSIIKIWTKDIKTTINSFNCEELNNVLGNIEMTFSKHIIDKN